MLLKNEVFKKYPNLHEGIRVKTSDGDDVGKIVELYDSYFILEKGVFFPKEFTARYDDIRELQDGVVYLRQVSGELVPWKEEDYEGWTQTSDLDSGALEAKPSAEYVERHINKIANEANVGLAEEELQTIKSLKEIGRLTVRKVVHTEFKHFLIPVMREEISIERGAISTPTSPESLNESHQPFQEESYTIPLMEEEVTVTKRPVIREEVKIKKDQVFEEREISGQVRKEDIEIKEEGQIPRKKAG
jgi:uncharacterized protein (TIGR02271 family)